MLAIEKKTNNMILYKLNGLQTLNSMHTPAKLTPITAKALNASISFEP